MTAPPIWSRRSSARAGAVWPSGQGSSSSCLRGGAASARSSRSIRLTPAPSWSPNEVSFNGGVSDSFPTVILRTSSSREGIEVSVDAVGYGLAAVLGAVLIAAPDERWQVGLDIRSRSNSNLVASATLAADLPAEFLRATQAVRNNRRPACRQFHLRTRQRPVVPERHVRDAWSRCHTARRLGPDAAQGLRFHPRAREVPPLLHPSAHDCWHR